MITSDESDVTSSDSSEEEVEIGREKDPVAIPFHFLKTGLSLSSQSEMCIKSHFKGKSKKEGVLITHDMFKFQKNNSSRDLSTWWYTCSHKNTHGCNARAIIKRKEIVREDGELWVENILMEVATPEVNDPKLL